MGSAWNKNNWRELRKTMGRFLAIVSIVALGVGFFTGLKSARPTMVKTCNDYLDRMQFYDFQLISSIGFDQNAAEAFQDLNGVAAAEGGVSADLLARVGDTEMVFKTHQLLSTVNQVQLTVGRMPEAANECLADDLVFTEDDLGTELTVQHQEDSVFSQDSYIIVGLANSPQYLSMSRGTTSLGNGTVTGFLFLTEAGYDTDYDTELYLRLEGERDAFDSDYLDYLATWEDPLLDILEPQGQQRLDHILVEARQELDDGWQEYYDAVEEYETTKADVEAELADAEAELADAAQQLADGRKSLADGEATLQQLINDPYSIPELAEAREQLEQGRAELEDGEAQYEEGLAQYNAMKGPLSILISEAKQALGTAQTALDTAHAQYSAAETAFREAEAALKEQQTTLYAPVAELEQSLRQAESDLAAKQTELDQLQQAGGSPVEIAAATLAVEAAQAEVQTKETAYKTAKAAYDAQEALLQTQLNTANQQLQQAKSVLDESQAAVDTLNATIADGEAQLDESELQLLEAKVQLEEGRAQLEEGEATLQQEIQTAIATAQTQLDEGRAQLADGQTQYEDGLQEFEDGKAEAEREFADAEKELTKAYHDLRQAELDLQRMEDPSYYVLTPSSNNGFVSFDNDTNIVEGVAKVFPLFFFLVAALVCSSTMTRMVEEQRTQNGTLKALGYSDGRIMLRYASYAGGAALIGSGIGLLIGTYLFPFVIWEAYKLLYHFGELLYTFNWKIALISVGAALLCSVGAACLAAWNDLQMMPAQLMRPKTPKAGKRIFLEYITPLWNSLGFLAKVSLRNIFRYKKRLFMMMLGTGGCLALLIAGLGLRDSIANVADDQFNQITMYDYSITFDSNQTAQDQADFEAEFGEALSRYAFVSASALDVPTERGTKSITVIACSDPVIDQMLGLFWEGQDLGYPTGDGLYVSSALAEDAGLEVGDTLPLQLESNDRIEIPITGIFTNYVYHYAYMTVEGYETWFGIEPEIKTVLACAVSDDLYGTGAALQAWNGVVNVTMSQEIQNTVSNAMGSLNAIILLVVGCAIALAFVVTYNLININITERVREIATIKVLGFYRKESHSYVFRESILLTIMGTIVGVPLGIWLHTFIMNAIKVDFVCFQVQISLLSFVLAVALTTLVTLVVNRILSAKIDQINMAESLKSVE